MPIIVNLDVMMAKRKVGAGELAKAIGITPANLSIFKKRQSQGGAFYYPGGFMPGAELPAGRYPGICSGRRE